MRRFLMVLTIFAAGPVWAEGHMAASDGTMEFSEAGDFKLGGAATRSSQAARLPTAPIVEPEERPALRLPFIIPDGEEIQSRRERTLGPATLFLKEGLDYGRDALQMGTFLSRGAARAGLSVTYLETEALVSRSSIFVDFAFSEQFSIGLAGILDNELDETEPVRQLGLNAEFSTDGGAFLQGGVAGAEDYDPVIGLSVGLRF